MKKKMVQLFMSHLVYCSHISANHYVQSCHDAIFKAT